MRWLLMALLLGGCARTLPSVQGYIVSHVSTQGTTSPASGAAPTTASDGLNLEECLGHTVSVAAPAGQTLGGAGYIRAYRYSYVTGLWARNPTLDVAVTDTGRVQVAADSPGYVRNGRVFYRVDGVTFTGGGSSGAVVTVECFR